MKKLLPIAVLCATMLTGNLFALPPSINFSYDPSGNRTSRTVFLPSPPPSPSDADAFTDPVLANEFSEKIYTDKLNESDVLIFPNPTQGALAVEIQNMNPQIPHHLTVFNIRGAVVFERSNIADRTEIDLSAQPSGVYIMRIFTKDSAIAWRIVKE